jgi:hypothetical protein
LLFHFLQAVLLFHFFQAVLLFNFLLQYPKYTRELFHLFLITWFWKQ